MYSFVLDRKKKMAKAEVPEIRTLNYCDPTAFITFPRAVPWRTPVGRMFENVI